jgi:hypothetical protein
MRWSEFAKSCPEFAGLIRERFERQQIFLLGTVRPDGSPRISGVECDFVGDDLSGFIGLRESLRFGIDQEGRDGPPTRIARRHTTTTRAGLPSATSLRLGICHRSSTR